MIEVQKIAAWIPVSDEALADAPLVRTGIEYHLYGAADAPLSPVERTTGLRSFTSSEGYTAQFRVGWRLALYEALQRFAAAAWPEDQPPEDDD